MTTIRSLARWIADHEIWLLALVIPPFLFPTRFSPWGLGLIPLPWLCRWVGRGYLTHRTPLDLPILLLLLMIPITLWATALPEITRPAVYKLLAGMALFYGIVNWARDEKRIWWIAWGLIGVGMALTLSAPFGVHWGREPLFKLTPLTALFPTLLPEAINANVMAGALVILFPLPFALLVLGGRDHSSSAISHSRLRGLALALVSLVMLSILLATQSRGAYIAAVVVIGLLLAWRNPWFLLGGLPVLGGLGYIGWRVGWGDTLDLMTRTGSLQGLDARLEIWSRALYMMGDFPFTGVGMGTFNQVANVLYPFFLHGSDAQVPHAHNLFLQVGVDLGYPGLIAFVAILLLSIAMTWRSYCLLRRWRGLALGLLGSYTALILHGLVDAVSWGTKPAIIPWALFGLTAALYNLSFIQGGQGI
ncbi:MAG: O-antigen ligase family protein [Chloroflexota bacterium]|nr:O-antigen ligase family protein [Chloroflexota bacterium]